MPIQADCERIPVASKTRFGPRAPSGGVCPRLTLETYGTSRGPGFTQAGVRFNILSDKLTFDVRAGNRIRRFGDDRYATLGLTVAGPALR